MRTEAGTARRSPPSRGSTRGDDVVGRTVKTLEAAFAGYHPRDFAVRFWDGSEWAAEVREPRFTLVLRRPEALRRMISTGNDLGAGEAFIFGDFDVEGDLEALFSVVDHLAEREWTPFQRADMLAKALRLPAPEDGSASRPGVASAGGRHSRERDRAAIAYHYDVSNDFYGLWLDSGMVYSCGYFRTPDEDLDAAQRNKLDLICRKLRLAEGERLLDIGCGWGALVMHAARETGAEAVGITLSASQADLANARIEAAGLSDRCRVVLVDYRDAASLGPFDKVASVGMFEHVGEERLPEYFAAAFDALRPGGLFLNHGIARPAADRYGMPREASPAAGRPRRERDERPPSFSETYVFPDGELVPIGVALSHAENAGFEVRDTESLREHYARTLRHWVARLEAARDDAVAEVGEERYRLWRLYMTASACGFATGNLGVYQALLARPDGSGACELPDTREDLYRAAS